MPTFRGGVWELVAGTPVYPNDPSLSHIVRDFKARLTKPVTQSFPTGITNSGYVWKTDGTEVGRHIEYSNTNTGSYDNRIYGQLDAGDYVYNFSNDFFPVIASPYYPTPVMNASGGIRYQPIAPGLSSSLELPNAAKTFGFATEIYFTIVNINNYQRRLTITGIDFAPEQYFLYLEETNVGDGSAYRQNAGTAQRPNWYYAWRLSYNAKWKFWNAGTANILVGIGGFSIGRSVGPGDYKLSDLIGTGASTTQTSISFIGGEPTYAI